MKNEQMNMVQDEVNLKEILSPLWARRWKIIFFTLLVTFAVSFYVSLLKQSYQATAILQIGNNQPSNTLSINDAFDESVSSYEQIQTQYQLLRSRKFAERVVTLLNLVEHEEFNSGKYNDKFEFLAKRGKSTTNPSISQVVGAVSSRLRISPIKETELVRISFTAFDPVLARRVANKIGETYLEYQDEIHKSSKESTSKWLVDQLAELGRKLEVSEQMLQTYRENEKIVDIKGVDGLIESELRELTSSVLRHAKKEDDLKVIYQYIQKNKKNYAQITELQEVNTKQSYMQLRHAEDKLERKLDEILPRYGPKHPKMIAVEAELKSIRLNLTQQVLMEMKVPIQ